ncbi:hypothetical protein [Bradyrhizobium sp. McL0616]|uniref:hypothetical protein n=1 Tax=Bradyrhizobium sp. McL0616 TaxID=3415674 RepID=UPI003CECE585
MAAPINVSYALLLIVNMPVTLSYVPFGFPKVAKLHRAVHCSVIFIALGLVDRFIAVKEMSDGAMLAAFAGCAATVVAVSALTFRYIEAPFMGSRAKTAMTYSAQPST